jgi:hypothetical protein
MIIAFTQRKNKLSYFSHVHASRQSDAIQETFKFLRFTVLRLQVNIYM